MPAGVIEKECRQIEGGVAAALRMHGAHQLAADRRNRGGAQIGARRLGRKRQHHAGARLSQFAQIFGDVGRKLAVAQQGREDGLYGFGFKWDGHK